MKTQQDKNDQFKKVNEEKLKIFARQVLSMKEDRNMTRVYTAFRQYRDN